MAERAIPKAPPQTDFKRINFIPSGSHMLDLVLGGGYAGGRVVNVVGDRSAGKTALLVEACASFVKYVGSVEDTRYVEAESAFDESYADTIGMPRGLKTSSGIDTVEDFYNDLSTFLKEHPKGPSLYGLDSLDALSDAAEMDRELDKGSYGASKARMLSQVFRRIIRPLEDANCTLFVISQVRENIGVTFGDKYSRSGGKALDFYASQILWLAHKKRLSRTVKGSERVIGTEVRAWTKKNKVAPPFREADITILFNYGMDDEETMLSWLESNKATDGLGADPKEIRSALAKARRNQERDVVNDIASELKSACTARWNEIEDALRPSLSKYGD